MPVLDGLEATRQIVADERLDSVRVVVLTNFGLDEYIFRALRAGAGGFLLKDTQPAELPQALRVVMRGDALLSPAVTRRLIGEFVARPPDAVAAVGMETLTNREREVVALVAHGLSNDEIAGAMVLSPATAKTHVSRAMIKLGARDRAQLVVFAYQTGLVTPARRRAVPGQLRRWRCKRVIGGLPGSGGSACDYLDVADSEGLHWGLDLRCVADQDGEQAVHWEGRDDRGCCLGGTRFG
jgi:DNA-binding NarL/FixJ family response regulator